MAKRKKSPKKNLNSDTWTCEQYEEYMGKLYGMDFIVGFTEGGAPYGTYIWEDAFERISGDGCGESDEEIPF